MFRGRIVGEFDAATATVKEIGLAMAGISPQAAKENAA
jgi:hypothetical protein